MLEYKIDGPALKDGIPMHLVTNALENFQTILDKSYLIMSGAKRMTSRDRESFQLIINDFSRGSLITNFDIVLSGVQLTLPFISELGPQNIWDYTKDTFNFLKLVCSSVRDEEKPKYEFNNDGEMTVITGDIHHHYHSQVFQIGELALSSYQDLAHLIDPGKLNQISAGEKHKDEPDIYLGEGDKDIFDVPKRIEQETVSLKCEIFDFNKFKNAGKLSVTLENQAIEIGEYNFSIIGSQNQVDYIYSMLKPEVELSCLIEMESNPFGEDKVFKLHITGVRQ